MSNLKIITMIMTVTLLLLVNICSAARVVKQGGSVYIQDRTGERWDVTQAQTLGFKPHKFQYGIGKNAFTPLQDEDFHSDDVSSFYNTRVIGVSLDNNAHAYTVDRLKHHETANTTIGGTAIVAGY